MVYTPTRLEQNCGHPSLNPGRRQKEPGASPSFGLQGVRTNNMNVFRMTPLPRGEKHACGDVVSAAVESSVKPIYFALSPEPPCSPLATAVGGGVGHMVVPAAGAIRSC